MLSFAYVVSGDMLRVPVVPVWLLVLAKGMVMALRCVAWLKPGPMLHLWPAPLLNYEMYQKPLDKAMAGA